MSPFGFARFRYINCSEIWRRFVLQWLAVGGLWLLAGLAAAQSLPANITPEQIERFKSLPRAQQEMIARQYGVDPAQLTASQRASAPKTLSQPQVVIPLQQTDQGRPSSGYPAPYQSQSYLYGAPQDQMSSESQQLYGLPSERVGDQSQFGFRNPLRVSGQQNLKPFGYELFAGAPTTFAPVTEIPIPTEYVIGPGDSIRLQLFGKENQQLELLVTRDGTIELPQAGPIPVAGLSFDELKQKLNRWVREKYIGVESSVSLGELRSMQVFVLGEARTPGAYTVSSLSTMTNALFVSGGVKESGSLRKIQLKRQGSLVSELDLYDLLLRGDTKADQRLMPGDVIFIPPVGTTVAIQGEIRRPAIYELKAETTIGELVEVAGGYRPNASPRFTKVERVAQNFQRSVLDVDLTSRTGTSFQVENGDYITVGSVNSLVEGFVSVVGEVVRPGNYDWQPGMRVSSLFKSIRHDLKEAADLDYALIVREINERREIKTLAVNLGDAILQPGSAADIELQERDQLLVFRQYQVGDTVTQAEYPNQRHRLLEPVLERLQAQARAGQPPLIVEVAGNVKLPGRYPLTDGATATEMVQAAGGLRDSSYTVTAEVSRAEVASQDEAKVNIFDLNLAQAYQDPTADILIQPLDVLTVKSIPDYAERLEVTLQGEVRFPGTYRVRKGETLSQLLQRAGGLTSNAFPRGALFTRESLKELEAARLREASQRLQADLATMQLQGQETSKQVSASDMQELQSLLDKVQAAKPLGRLVINLEDILTQVEQHDVTLQDGDTLVVPQKPQSISVIGEVQYATSHIYEVHLSVQDYLSRSGGFTRRADPDKVYVVKANGSVWIPRQSSWFGGRQTILEPGDTIVVPLEVDRLNKLQLWTNVTQIFYQMALGAAAIASF